MRRIVEEAVQDDYRASAERLKVLGNTFSAATVGRILRREGERVQTELYGPDAMLAAARTVPANPPDLLIVSGDGSRYRTNEADRRKKKKTTTTAPASAPASRHESALTSEESDHGWRENKIGVVVRAQRGAYQPDGTYRSPREGVKSYVGMTEGIESFGRNLRTEADRRGARHCREVVFVADHGHGLPEMQAREFPEAQVVTDFYHVAERLMACARVLKGDGPASAGARMKCWRNLRSRLWCGEVARLIRQLTAEAKKLAPRPASLPDLAEQPGAQTLWTHVFYLEKHQDTMDYPKYRGRGWPLGSGTVESACGQFGDRFKHSRMRWTRRTANAAHHVKAAILSQDGRWDRRWPPPIPVLELPAVS